MFCFAKIRFFHIFAAINKKKEKMKRTTMCFVLCMIACAMVCGQDSLHIKRYLGQAVVAQKSVTARNAYYWSVGVEADGEGQILPSKQVLSTGVGQADFRICTYEDGSPICESNQYFLCVSSRLAGVGQTVYAYDLNTCKFTLIGAMQGFFTDGSVRGMVAPHIIYNRKDGAWYVFAHWGNPHCLCVGKTLRDPRYGYNEITCSQLDYSDIMKGDEDNFVYYDDERGEWILIYSKGSSTLSLQRSDRIDGGYKLIKQSDAVKSLTGINVVRIGGKRYVVSGFGWTPEDDRYKVFSIDDLSYLYDLNLDMPTGGFRGWGTILDVVEGEETKYQLLTFDRINPTKVDNWQYGNTYLYEAVERNKGVEYDLHRADGQVIKANASTTFSPDKLHFRRKFALRHNYSQQIETGVMDFSSRIFLKWGSPYPVKDNSGNVSYSQDGKSVLVKGKGRVSLLGGTHLPNCEYLIDLTEMSGNEVRYLKIGTQEEDLVNIRFKLVGNEITVCSGTEPVLTFTEKIRKVRVLVIHDKAYFVDAEEF